MTKKAKNTELINYFISSYKLLIYTLKATSNQGLSHNECEKCMQLQISTTALIKDIERAIQEKKLYNVEFLNLKHELEECAKKFYKLSPEIDISSETLSTKLNHLKQEFYTKFNIQQVSLNN